MGSEQTSRQPISNQRNSLSLSTPVYHQLLKKLNINPSPTSTSHPSRCFTRLEYVDPYLELTLTSPDNGHRSKITVATRNISRGGMSVLHSNFIYSGTVIQAQLHREDKSTQLVSGVVRRCSHRGGIVHEIGIKFNEQIIIQEFAQSNIHKSVRSLETVNPNELNGSILFVGNDPQIIPAVREYLLDTSLKFGFSETAEDALSKNFRDHDLIFVCLDAGDKSGSEFARALRVAGFNRPIILSGISDSQAIKQQVGISSADMFLESPFTNTTLFCALAEFLLFNWTDQQLEHFRVSSSLEQLDEMLKNLDSLGITLDQQIKANDPVQIYITGTEIRKAALALGLKSLHDLTLSVCDEIAQSGDLSAYSNELNRIRLLCIPKKAA